MEYFKGTKSDCEAYNQHVAQQEGYTGHTTYWAHIIERNGNYYIRKHPNYEPTSGLTEAELPEPEDIDEI